MLLCSRVRRRLLLGAVGGAVGMGSLATASQAFAAYTPGLEQYGGSAGCIGSTTIAGCAEVAFPTAAQGITRDGDDLYLSTGDDTGGPSGLFHLRRTPGGPELRSCVVQTPSAQSVALGCAVVSLLPKYVTRPALAGDAVYVGGAYAGQAQGRTGGIAVIGRDPESGELRASGATCRAASSVDAPECDAATQDQLGNDVIDLVVAPDDSTVHAVASKGASTQLVTYARDADSAALTPASCLSNANAHCNWPFAYEKPLLAGATQLVIAPDGLDAYLASPKGVVHLTRGETTGLLDIEDCVGDGEDVAALCDEGPGDFRGVSSIAMQDDDQVIAVAFGDDSTSVVRLLRDGAGTLTEAGCIGTVAEDGCGVAAGITKPTIAAATPDGKNVIVAGESGQPLVTLIAGGVTGLRPIPFGTSGCATVAGVTPPVGCAAEVRGVVSQPGPNAARTDLAVQDGEVVATSHGTILLFARGRAPGCLGRSVTVARPWASLPLSCGDPNGDQISYAIGREPDHGVLGEISQNPSTVGYTPDDTYEGPDSFTYGAGDGTFTSAPATYSLTLPSGPNTVKPDPAPGKGNGNGGDDKGAGHDNGGGNDDRSGDAPEPDAPGMSAAGDAVVAGGWPKPTGAAGMLDLSATSKQITVSSKRIVSFKVSCRGAVGAAPCKGGIRLSAASRLAVDGKRQVVTFGRKDYVVPVGFTFTISFRLSPKLAALVTKRKPVASRLLAIGTAPGTATPVTAAVSLKR